MADPTRAPWRPGRVGLMMGVLLPFGAIAVLLLAGSFPFLKPASIGDEIAWQKYSDAAMVSAAAEGKPVIIDFYADWCLPCKELDHKTFNQTEVIAESERFVRLKADLTKGDDPAALELVKKYGIVGVPTIAFFDASGKEVTTERLVGFERPNRFLERIKAVE